MIGYSAVVKPLVDLFFAVVFILILSPLLLLTWIIGLFVFGRPIFRQNRVGKNREVFTIIKFRSLKIAGDEKSIPLWGRFIRKTSLDELPQLLNILRGEMSFIGPRPLLPEYLPHYTERQQLRHTVKPGISGLAQVNGRNALSWEESLEWDAKYAENVNAVTDIKILLRTFVQLCAFSQVQQNKNVSRESFLKSKNK